MVEIWKPASGYEGLYEVSSHGRVARVGGDVRKLKNRKDGYLEVNLSKDGRVRSHKVHRLVAKAFLGPAPEGLEVCHNNGDKTDNRPENLRYDTHAANCDDRAIHGTCHFAAREVCIRGHSLDRKDNNASDPRKMSKGWRKCKACSRALSARQKHKDLAPFMGHVSNYYYENLHRRVTYQELVEHLREENQKWRS